jgi:hypothetical protein
MTGKPENETAPTEKPAITLPGTVEKIIPTSNLPKLKRQRSQWEGADHLYRDIRVDNELQDENGKTVSLKPGAHVEVTTEAEPEATRPTKLRDQERFF